MHKKKKYINKSMYSIQGLSTVGNSLPKSLNKILKKGGHNYSSIINNWVELVGKKTSDTGKFLKPILFRIFILFTDN